MSSPWRIGRHKRLLRLEDKRAQNSPVKVFVIGHDDPEPDYQGRKFVVRLAHTRAEMDKKKPREEFK